MIRPPDRLVIIKTMIAKRGCISEKSRSDGKNSKGKKDLPG